MSCTTCGQPLSAVITHGAAGIIKAVLHLDRAPEETILARRAICRACDHATKHPARKHPDGLPLISFCRLCHCHLRLKTNNADESCPAGRWPSAPPPRP